MSVLERLADVRARIAAAEKAAGRPAGAVKLIIVTKTFAAEAVEPLLAHGERAFGENRVQEAKAKWPALFQIRIRLSRTLPVRRSCSRSRFR